MTVPDSILISTMFITDKLTDDDLLAVYNRGSMGWPLDETVSCHKQASPLFPEKNGKLMHKQTLEALKIIVKKRLGVTPI